LEVLLDADSTPHEFAMRFLNKLMVGMYEAMSFWRYGNCNSSSRLRTMRQSI